MTTHESELLAKCKNGDSQAFGEIYQMYFDPIYRFLFYRVRHRQIAEDLASASFFKALRNIHKFSKGSLSAWLYTIARNTMADYFRTNKQTYDLEQSFGIFKQDNLDEKMDDSQQIEKIKQNLDQLSDIQKEIVVMRLWDELSYQEISEIVHKSQANCKVIFSRAIKNLKKIMQAALALIIALSL